jgi:hypothetical protein
MRVLLAIGAIFAVVLLAPVLLVVAIALGPAALGIAGLTAATLFVLFVLNLVTGYTRHLND